jgi:hypothetical protein
MDDDKLWTIYDSDGKRATIAAFFTKETAEEELEYWREREAKGGRPDVHTEGLYVGMVD